MPKPGDIFLYKDYEFDNGSKKDKLFVVLNDVTGDSPCLVLITTSQQKRYLGATKGCNAKKKVFFIPTIWQNCFNNDTYIQLPQIIEFSLAKLLENSMINKNISFLKPITSDCLAQLKNCLKKFKDHISPSHWKYIF